MHSGDVDLFLWKLESNADITSTVQQLPLTYNVPIVALTNHSLAHAILQQVKIRQVRLASYTLNVKLMSNEKI